VYELLLAWYKKHPYGILEQGYLEEDSYVAYGKVKREEL